MSSIIINSKLTNSPSATVPVVNPEPLDHGGELPDLGLLLDPDQGLEGHELTHGEHGGEAGVGLRHHTRVCRVAEAGPEDDQRHHPAPRGIV